MTHVFFNKEKLNQIRNSLISALEKADILMHRHYTLSKINEVGTNFVITFTAKGKSKLPDTKVSLQKKFEGMRIIHADTELGILQVDLATTYESLIVKNLKEEIQSVSA